MSESHSRGGVAGTSTKGVDIGVTDCPECGKNYETRTGLKHHLRKCSPERMVPCPNCEDRFLTSHGLKQHSTTVHGEPLTKQTTECEVCGEDFTHYPHANRDRKYCSRSCVHKSQEKENTGVTTECAECGETLVASKQRYEKAENHYCSTECKSVAYGGRETLTCPVCDVDFDVKSSHADRRVCCSMECYREYRSEAVSGENHPNWQGGGCILECEHCGDEYEEPQCNESRSRFCSKKCMYDWFSENRVGENSPNWKGGRTPDYGPNWPEQRAKALERDEYECQVCGASSEKYGCEVSVHHIQPRGDFIDENGELDHERANRLLNLVSLCRSCHRKWEGLYVRPDPRPTS